MLKRGLAFGGILAILSGVGTYNNIYAAETGSTKFSVDVNQAVLELTVPTNPTVIDLNPTMTNASFGTADLTVRVATNNMTGYQLTMTPTNLQTDTSLIRTELIGDEEDYREIETLEQTDPISTGYTEQTFTANAWGYKITGDNYYGIDPENTTVSHPAWVTSAPTNGTNHNLTLAAKVDADTVSGAYETTLNFRAVTNAVVAKDTVTFNGNGADGGSMDEQIVLTYGQSASLPANTFTKTGYAFLGWNTAQDGSGMSYADEGTYTAISSDYSHNITLYATWMDTSSSIYNKLHPGGSGLSGGITISRAYEIAYTNAGKGMWERDEGDRDNDGDTSEYYQVTDGVYHTYDVRWDMQGMTPEICGSVTVIDDAYRALDIRDNKLYFITKLQDGKCWMTENLDFNFTQGVAISNTDTDLNSKTSWTPTRSTITAVNYSTGGITGFSGTNTAPISVDGGDWYSDLEWTDQCSKIYTCSHFNDTVPTSLDDEKHHGHVGTFYNWAAAIAENNANTDYLNTNFNMAPDSVCPKGWKLPSMVGEFTPKIDSTQEFAYMNSFYDLKNNTDRGTFGAPVYLIRFGKAYYEFNFAENGYYWSNTAFYSVSSYYAHIDSVGGPTGNTVRSDKGNAQPVRCIAR